jgi:hypothetical protein
MNEEMMTELGFPLEVVEGEEAKGRWPDLTRLQARRPDVIHSVIWFLARGVSVRTICKALKPLSPCTVNRIRHDPRFAAAVVSENEDVVGMIDEVMMLKLEQLRDDAREGKLPNVFDLKMLFEIRQLKSGGATQRVEIKASAEEEQFMRFMAEARRAVTQGSGMVFDAEILPQSPIRELAPIPTPPRAQPIRTEDSESHVKTP